MLTSAYDDSLFCCSSVTISSYKSIDSFNWEPTKGDSSVKKKKKCSDYDSKSSGNTHPIKVKPFQKGLLPALLLKPMSRPSYISTDSSLTSGTKTVDIIHIYQYTSVVREFLHISLKS